MQKVVVAAPRRSVSVVVRTLMATLLKKRGLGAIDLRQCIGAAPFRLEGMGVTDAW